MLSNKTILPWILVTCFTVLFILDISDVKSAPYQPSTTIYLKTQYTNGEITLWKIVPEINQQGGTLKFYNNHQYHCKIDIKIDKSSTTSITLFDSADKLLHHTFNAFFPIPGFKVPLYMIDVESLEQEKDHFKIVQVAGGRKFSNLFYLSIEVVNIKEAVANQWILPDFKPQKAFDDAEKLYFYTVKSEAGQVIFKQLWQKDSSWWLYQEAQNEKSWRR